MVHALKKVHSLLKPKGLLIDIRPTGDPPAFEVHVDGQISHAGWYQETDDFVEYFQAQEALNEALKQGLFVLEQTQTIDFLTHSASIVELRDYLLAEYSDAIVDDEVVRQAEKLFATPGKNKDIVLRETAVVNRLRRT